MTISTAQASDHSAQPRRSTTSRQWDKPIDVKVEHVVRRFRDTYAIGLVFQNYALFRHLTVLGNVAFGLKVRPRNQRPSAAEIRKRALELIELVQLKGLEKR